MDIVLTLGDIRSPKSTATDRPPSAANALARKLRSLPERRYLMEKVAKPVRRSQAMPTIYTIGHSTRTIDEFLALLQQAAIDLLIDVRSVPRSRRVGADRTIYST
jgi:hypothetical protein